MFVSEFLSRWALPNHGFQITKCSFPYHKVSEKMERPSTGEGSAIAVMTSCNVLSIGVTMIKPLGLILLLASSLVICKPAAADRAIKVGVVSVLSGDMAVLGQNVVDTVETYKRTYLRHKLDFVYEDAKLSSSDGLRAYQKIVNFEHADLIIGGCSSNGTMAAKALIQSSRTPTITIVTGGKNIDRAGPFVFRVGNSDTLNGVQLAQHFAEKSTRRVALLTEETEYTQAIADAFQEEFRKRGGELVFAETFIPGTADFRSHIARIKKVSPAAIFMPTQTGTSLGLFVKQWHEQKPPALEIHTTFVAAPNPDAHAIAGEAMYGIYYMAPEYDRENSRLKEFVRRYRADHGHEPPIMFHTAGTIDALDLLQNFLDQNRTYDREAFAAYLLHQVKNYHGMMGTYSFDADGNADLGFTLAQIKRENAGSMK